MTTRTLRLVPLLAAAALLSACAVGTSTEVGGGTETGAKELASVPGFDLTDGVIHVGQMTALSGPVAPTASEQAIGQQAYYDIINAKGGVAGKYKIEVTTADNQYNPQLAVQEYQKVKGNVAMWTGILGDASNDALLPILKQDKAVALPSTQSARFIKDENFGMTFTSYQTNVWNALAYMFHEQKTLTVDSTVCTMVQADQSGQARIDAMKFGAEQLGFKVGTNAEFAPTDASFSAQVQSLKSGNCDVVVFGGAANNVPNVVAAATQLGFEPTWIAEFFAMSNAFKDNEIAPYLEANFLITGLAGNLDDTSIPGIKQLTDQIAPTPITMQHVYGFMQAITAVTILEKAVELGDLSGPGIMAAMDALDTISYEGLNGDMTYGPVDKRQLPDTSAIFAYDRTAPYGLKNLTSMYVAPEGRGPGF